MATVMNVPYANTASFIGERQPLKSGSPMIIATIGMTKL